MGRKRGPTNAQKRQAVLEAAAALAAERGRHVSLAEICSRAGVSRQTIYNHYGDKAGLFEVLAARGLAPLPCCPEPTGQPPEDALADYAATLLRWAYAPEQALALRARCRGLDQEPADGLGPRKAAIRRLAQHLHDETRAGRLQVHEPHAAAALFLDLVLGGPQLRIALSHEPPSLQALRDQARRCARLFLRGCAEPRPHPPPERRPLPLGAHAMTPSPAP